MKVPLQHLKAQHDPIRQDLLAALARVRENHNGILGDEVKQLPPPGRLEMIVID